MTLSARSSSDGGTVSPSAFAVFRLMTSSNFVGCSTGRSAGLAPLRILSTYVAARRHSSAELSSLQGEHAARAPFDRGLERLVDVLRPARRHPEDLDAESLGCLLGFVHELRVMHGPGTP